MEGFPVYSIAQLAREFLPRHHTDTGVYQPVANHKACPILRSWQVHAVVPDTRPVVERWSMARPRLRQRYEWDW